MMGRPSITEVWNHLGGSVSPRGGWTKARCIVHDDAHASASVNEDEGVFKCHACGAKGDVYKLIMAVEGVDYRTAKKRAAEITGEEIEDRPTGPAYLTGGKRKKVPYVPAWLR